MTPAPVCGVVPGSARCEAPRRESPGGALLRGGWRTMKQGCGVRARWRRRCSGRRAPSPRPPPPLRGGRGRTARATSTANCTATSTANGNFNFNFNGEGNGARFAEPLTPGPSPANCAGEGRTHLASRTAVTGGLCQPSPSPSQFATSCPSVRYSPVPNPPPAVLGEGGRVMRARVGARPGPATATSPRPCPIHSRTDALTHFRTSVLQYFRTFVLPYSRIQCRPACGPCPHAPILPGSHIP